MFALLAKILSSIVTVAAAATVAFNSAGTTLNNYSQNFFYPKPPQQNERLDLKVDSQCHYYQNGVDVGCENEGISFGTWEAKDLCREKFFNFGDLKPGDSGEDTISLHMLGQNGCGVWDIYDIRDTGNECTEPETKTSDRDCQNKAPGAKERNGELMENIEFKLWVDQGETPGFQGKSDPGEGDNIFNGKDHLIFDWQKMNRCPQKMPLWYALRQIRKDNKSLCDQADSDGDGANTQNNICSGIARDGHLVKGAVYYYGYAWRFPSETGNEAQTDALGFNMRFTVVPNDRCMICSNPCDSCQRQCPDCQEKCQDCVPERCECAK